MHIIKFPFASHFPILRNLLTSMFCTLVKEGTKKLAYVMVYSNILSVWLWKYQRIYIKPIFHFFLRTPMLYNFLPHIPFLFSLNFFYFDFHTFLLVKLIFLLFVYSCLFYFYYFICFLFTLSPQLYLIRYKTR